MLLSASNAGTPSGETPGSLLIIGTSVKGSARPAVTRRAAARQGAAAPRAPRNGLKPGTVVPGKHTAGGTTADSSPRTPLTRHWRCWRWTGVSASGEGWRRDCHPGGSRKGGQCPPSTPGGTAAAGAADERGWTRIGCPVVSCREGATAGAQLCAPTDGRRPAGVGTPALQNGKRPAGVGTPARENGKRPGGGGTPAQ